MRKLPSHYIVTLLILGAGTLIRISSAEPTRMSQNYNLPFQIPLELGGYVGTDETEDAKIAAYFHHLPPEWVLLRQYKEARQRGIELYMSAQLADLTGCFRYSGWIINFFRETELDLPGMIHVRELIALSPAGQPDEKLACVAYRRTEKGAIANPYLLWDLFRDKADIVLGNPSSMVAVRLCTELKDEASPEPAFARMRSFAILIDPFLQAAIRHSRQNKRVIAGPS